MDFPLISFCCYLSCSGENGEIIHRSDVLFLSFNFYIISFFVQKSCSNLCSREVEFSELSFYKFPSHRSLLCLRSSLLYQYNTFGVHSSCCGFFHFWVRTPYLLPVILTKLCIIFLEDYSIHVSLYFAWLNVLTHVDFYICIFSHVFSTYELFILIRWHILLNQVRQLGDLFLNSLKIRDLFIHSSFIGFCIIQFTIP